MGVGKALLIHPKARWFLETGRGVSIRGGIWERRSENNHKGEVDVQILMKDPDYCFYLKVSHKKNMMLARLKQKARSKRWSRMVVA